MPVVGGNVSLYNESADGPIYPTPVVGIVGELPDVARAGRAGFARAGDAVGFAGPFRPRLAGSELAKLRGEELPLGLEPIDIAAVRAAQVAIRDAVRDGSLSSAHDVAEGGFLVAVAESCLAGGLGATLDLGPVEDAAELERILFGESPGRGLRRIGPRGRAAPPRRARRARHLRHRRRRRARRHERRRAVSGRARRAARGASGARAAVSLASREASCQFARAGRGAPGASASMSSLGYRPRWCPLLMPDRVLPSDIARRPTGAHPLVRALAVSLRRREQHRLSPPIAPAARV